MHGDISYIIIHVSKYSCVFMYVYTYLYIFMYEQFFTGNECTGGNVRAISTITGKRLTWPLSCFSLIASLECLNIRAQHVRVARVL